MGSGSGIAAGCGASFFAFPPFSFLTLGRLAGRVRSFPSLRRERLSGVAHKNTKTESAASSANST